jgi:hypothetical protein
VVIERLSIKGEFGVGGAEQPSHLRIWSFEGAQQGDLDDCEGRYNLFLTTRNS